MQLIELNKKQIEHFPSDLQKKILHIHQGNINFSHAIENLNFTVLEELLEKNYPMSFSTFSQDEQCLIGEISEDWNDNFHYISYFITHQQAIKEENQKLRDLLAKYWIYQKNNFILRKVYFACSTNTEQALHYAKNLYETMNFLHEEKSEWIAGAIHHQDNKYFDAFLDIHKQSGACSRIFSPLYKGYYLNEEKIPYNFNS